MALNANQQKRVRAALHRAYSAQEILIPWTKPQADAAIAASDAWIDSAGASYNSALPVAYRTSASTSDKALLLAVNTIAQQLVNQPTHLAMLSQILGELQGIEGEV